VNAAHKKRRTNTVKWTTSADEGQLFLLRIIGDDHLNRELSMMEIRLFTLEPEYITPIQAPK
jgi:hypothetical protein